MSQTIAPKLSPQCRQLLSLLKTSWPGGMHSHDLRALHSIGDPSKRVCELKDGGYEIRVEQANRGKRNGVLFILHRPEYEAVPASITPAPSGSDGEPNGLRPVEPAAVSLPSAAAGRSLPVSLSAMEEASQRVKDGCRQLDLEGRSYEAPTFETVVRLAVQLDLQEVAA